MKLAMFAGVGGKYHKTSETIKLLLCGLTWLDNMAVVLTLPYAMKKLRFGSHSGQDPLQSNGRLV